MKIAILGYGKQGASALEYFNNGENQITVCDKDLNLITPADIQTQLGENYMKNLDRFDMIIRAPGIHPREIVKSNSSEILNKVSSNTNEFFKVCPTKNIIGVTGTKGKGTTSTLITEMLKKFGYTVHLGGNIGTPPLDLLNDGIKEDDWVVLELANFQLIDLKYSPKFSVCLLVDPEHLDWHKDMEEYKNAKKQLFVHQTKKDYAIYYKQNEYSTDIASVSPAQKLFYFDENLAHIEQGELKIGKQIICNTKEIGLLGEHNWQNICASITVVWQVKQDASSIQKVVTEMKGLPYRNELRKTVNGVSYYNDSFSTAPIATLASIKSITKTKILIIGGFERGIGLSELMDCINEERDKIRHILLIGQSKERVAEALKGIKFSNFTIIESNNMNDIVAQCREFALPGDAVVLSPGFASFGMFQNFEHRGNEFNKAVESL